MSTPVRTAFCTQSRCADRRQTFETEELFDKARVAQFVSVTGDANVLHADPDDEGSEVQGEASEWPLGTSVLPKLAATAWAHHIPSKERLMLATRAACCIHATFQFIKRVHICCIPLTGLGGAIIPGSLCASLFPAIIGTAFPGALYLSQTLKFRNAALVGFLMLQ